MSAIPLADLATLLTLGLAVLVATPILGTYMAQVMEGHPSLLRPLLGPVERGIYRLAGIDPSVEQGWRGYAVALLVFSLAGTATLFVLLRLQDQLPLDPTGAVAQSPELAFNTAVSFETNTDWQNYAGETGASALTSALGLTVRNFTSAAAGIAVAVAFIRGLVRRGSGTIGNFWVDLTRAALYILLPLSVVGALVLVWQGVPQDLSGPTTVGTLEGGGGQRIVSGLVASQEWIKQLGTNGGGPLNANAAHPFENPTPLTDWLGMFAILAIPFGLTATFGRMAGDRRQGWAVFAAMAGVLLVAALLAMSAESAGNPLFPAGVDQSLGNMEGKEVRIGAPLGGLWAAVTTGTSTGAVNAMHSSLQPVSGLIALFLMQMGGITPGGVGSGLYGMLVLGALLSVFIAGLMVGRTPEYLGKKVEAFEMKMSMLVVVVLAVSLLGFTALAAATPEGRAGPLGTGPHAFSEILYAYSSQTGNNGSAFAGLSGDTPFYDLTGALAMLVGRFGMIVPVLAIAGSMAAKRRVAPSLGTFPTTGPTFVVLLVGVVIVVGALAYFPALALGPIAEQLILGAGRAL